MASCLIANFLSILHEENSSLLDLQPLHKKLLDRLLSLTYSVRDGLLLYQNRYYISPHSSLKDQLLHEFHSTPLAGHGGVNRTLVRLSAFVFWSRMRRDVRNFVEACLHCQQTKYSTQASAGLLQLFPIPSLVWDEVTMDFITSLPPSRGFIGNFSCGRSPH